MSGFLMLWDCCSSYVGIHVKVDFGIVPVLKLHITAMQLLGCQWSGISHPNSFWGALIVFLTFLLQAIWVSVVGLLDLKQNDLCPPQTFKSSGQKCHDSNKAQLMFVLHHSFFILNYDSVVWWRQMHTRNKVATILCTPVTIGCWPV